MGQFKALSQKNWILWKRSLCGNITELVIPIIFIAFIVAIRRLITIDTYTAQQFLGNPIQTFTMYGQKATTTAQAGRNFLKNCPNNTIVGLSPTGNSLVNSLNTQFSLSGYTTQIFNSDSVINSYVRSLAYGVSKPKFCFAVSVVESTAGGAYTYKLRFNASRNNQQLPSTTAALRLAAALDLKTFNKAASSGVLGTTTLINNMIYQTQSGVSTNVFKNTQAPIYQQAYSLDTIYTEAKNNVAILFLLPLLIIYLRLTSIMLLEKEKKIRETMSIMGMNIPVYYFTWFLRYFITFLIVHIIGSIIIARTLVYVPFYVPFVIFILFDILLIAQSFFIQTFFSRSKIGIVFALLFFLVQFIISFVSSNSDNPTESVNTAISIVPHVALILCFQTMLYAESIQTKISFTQSMNNYTLSTAVASFIINIIFWLVLSWYLEQVFPNEFGAKKHPLFCFFDKNSSKNKVKDSNIQAASSDSIIDDKKKKYTPEIQEVDQKFKVQQTQNKIINIENLRKQFNDGDMIAVNDLNIKMYNDNIFVLLGHNGAGKTTTISMLTGMLEPTSGTIQVLGETKLQKIRQQIGVCPQHDTLYEDLTVQEHLELFGTFRGLAGQQLEEQVNKLIADVNLSQKKDQYSKNLSGGQKRRLSVAMAFAGRSKVIILDEPTSGMDTSARRYIWELLKSYKTDRIILMTTHFMDEADYLGDRIGIMAGGRLICCGSGYYLKNKFGVGYNITFVKHDSQTKSSQIVKIVQKHTSRATLLSDVSSELTMQLPMDEVKKFPEMFNEIDTKKQALGIQTYGISITTLEEVFLKVGQQTQHIDEVRHSSHHVVQGQIVVRKEPYQKVDISLTMKQQQLAAYEFGVLKESQKIDRIDGTCNRFALHLWATILKRLRVIKRDYKSFILELLLPMGIIILALLLMTVSFIVDSPTRTLSLSTYASQASPLIIPIGSADQTLLGNLQTKLNARYGSAITVQMDTSSTLATDFDLNFLKPRKQSIKFLMGGIFFSASATATNGNTLLGFTSIVNTRIPTSCLYLQTLAAQTYINFMQSSNISITLIQDPFPRTYNQLQINNTISGFFGALVFSIALGFKFASIISFIVKQREDRSKHQQIVSGMNIFAYWFGNFIFDYVLYVVLAVFSFGMCQALSVGAFTGDAYGTIVLTFFLYGLAYIPMTYIFSYLFKDYGNAQAGYYFFTFVVGGLLSVIVLVLRFLGGTPNTIGLVVAWILRFVPAYAFGEILINIGSINLLGLVQLPLGQSYGPWDAKISMIPLTYLIVQIFAYTALVFILEYALNSENFMRFLTSENKIEDTQQVTDSDVIQMRQKALKADPEQYEILTKDLRKVFILDSDKKHKVAVDNLSLAIQKGEVFGLLGVNGAGKTTTFKMLAGQITSTSGDSFFTGMKISDNLDKVRQNLGYCPQFDALIDNLTVREQLEMFYDMKSLPGIYKNQLVNQKIKEMDLQNYQDKLSGTLSGGNKRKLSVAMAMIGNPNIIFLDEPSTGMDPKARRFMWKIISRIASQKKQSTIILTTHSMQQAEALSTRLGIMVKGNFKCIGTPQHIKSKYGQGYEVEMKIVPCSKDQINTYMKKSKLQTKIFIQKDELQGFLTYLNVDPLVKNQISATGSGNYIFNQLYTSKKIESFQVVEFILLSEKVKIIKQWMKAKFGQADVIEAFQTFIRFKVKAHMSVGKMFQVLQSEKQKIEVESYSIKQATVQQIFNRFAEQGDQSELMA